MKYKFIFFDVANTLLHKPLLYKTLDKTLNSFGIFLEEDLIIKNHTIISQLIKIPSKTTKDFYDNFNSEFLYSCGIIPNKTLIDTIYRNCKNLKWEAFKDIDFLSKISLPMGVISNWDETMERHLKENIKIPLDVVISSHKTRILKPSLKIFQYALSKITYPTKNILYVGDSLKLDIEPAIKLKLNAILIDRNNLFPHYKGMRIKSLGELENVLNI